MYNIQELLQQMVDKGASDLHLTAGSPPMIRKSGHLEKVGEEVLTPQETLRLSYSVMNEFQRKTFEQKKECDFSFGIGNIARFRANAYLQRGCVATAIRMIPLAIRPFEELDLPDLVRDFAERPNGLVLVTGSTGSGKSTTLAAMIDRINRTRDEHIVTIEDPIEFLHKHNRCLVNQREIGSDTLSFTNALKSALRQDPDVVLIGEMRDIETIRAALTIAETGHLTFATLHTNSAVQTVHRIVNAFPADEQQTIRAQLGFVLQGVVCQMLVPKVGGGRIMVAEVLDAIPAIKALIRDDKVHQIESHLEINRRRGMITMNARLIELVNSGAITEETAFGKSPNPDQLQKQLLDSISRK